MKIYEVIGVYKYLDTRDFTAYHIAWSRYITRVPLLYVRVFKVTRLANTHRKKKEKRPTVIERQWQREKDTTNELTMIVSKIVKRLRHTLPKIWTT